MNRSSKRQKGAILVLFLLFVVFLFSMIAIAVDVGHLFLVQAELRKAADAASLAGTARLFPTTSDGKPNWELGMQKALEAVSLNSADGSYLSTATIEAGYWDLTGAESGIRDSDAVPDPGADDIPAIRVVISRSAGENGGPVSLYFGAFVGVSTKDVSAESVAGGGSPRAVSENTLFPMVFPASVYEEYWNYSTQQPKIDPLTGDPYVFDIGGDGQNGQWTSFEDNLNTVTALRDLMENGNPNTLAIGQEVYVVSGVKASLYNDVPSDIEVTVAILSNTIVDGVKEVIGFGTMYIHYATGANTKTITVNLAENKKTEGGTPGGYYYGTYVPPKLVH